MAKALILRGIDYILKDPMGRTLLYTVAKITSLLIEAGAD